LFPALSLFYNDELDYCEYQTIVRPTEASDNLFQYTKVVQFKTDVDPDAEFLRVACYGDRTASLLYTNFHAFILLKEPVEERCTKNFRTFLKNDKPKEVTDVCVSIICQTTVLFVYF